MSLSVPGSRNRFGAAIAVVAFGSFLVGAPAMARRPATSTPPPPPPAPTVVKPLPPPSVSAPQTGQLNGFSTQSFSNQRSSFPPPPSR